MEEYHMDITILNICRLPENSNLLQQLCISQFQLDLRKKEQIISVTFNQSR